MAFNINLDVKWLIIPVLIVVGLLAFSGYQHKNNSELETYNRQLRNDLTSIEKELQSSNHELGVARSQLVTQAELADRLKNDNEEVDKEFEEFKKKHNLMIKSRDRAIASLKQKVEGGTTTVVVSDDEKGCNDIEDRCVISYNWEDTLSRFKLSDPNIFEKDNETFESNQIFKIYGEIYAQKDGSLQTRRLVIREVYQQEDGSYAPIPDGKANIVDSQFEYHNPPVIDTESKWTDIFRLRVLMASSVTMFPDGGVLRLALGAEFINIAGIGINTHTAFDFSDAEKIEQRIGMAYNPSIFGSELNFSIGISVGTPFAHLFDTYSANLDLIFYLNN